MTAEEIARVCHEANRAVTQIVADVPVQPNWDCADADMKTSSVNGVAFALNNPNATAEQQHEAWCVERRAQGWVFGEKKDPIAKTHPALRPFAELPLGTRQKDAVFRAIVAALR